MAIKSFYGFKKNGDTYKARDDRVENPLGTSAYKNSTSVVTDSTDLVESGAVYTALQGKADNSVIGTVEDGTNPTKSYAVGEHMVRGGKFCTVTVAVTTSSTWMLGGNYVEGDVSSDLVYKVGDTYEIAEGSQFPFSGYIATTSTLYFTIPINKPLVGVTNCAISNASIVIRGITGQLYSGGISAFNFAPTIRNNFIRVALGKTDAFNASLIDTPCIVSISGTLTFS